MCQVSELWCNKCLCTSCTSFMEGHPGCKTCQHLDTSPCCTAGKLLWQRIAVVGEVWTNPTPPLQCYTNWGSVCWRECSSACRFLLLFLWFTVTSFWKKICYLTLYLTSKLPLVVVSSAMFIFHQIMFVSNVCKS